MVLVCDEQPLTCQKEYLFEARVASATWKIRVLGATWAPIHYFNK
ncbi:MAG: hypothetical protein BMS9Abin05_1596 [Rhodothermia bacterium]|nr:MAG: hypothetical protein BMS9Abin05_1596 [Rhodothermia bacterium]